MIAAATIIILILINALYVAAEFSSVSARRTRIYQLADEGDRLALVLKPVLADSRRLDRYVATCQVGITASSLALGFYGQGQLAGWLGPLVIRIGGLSAAVAESVAATAVLIFLTTIQVLLGELVPKSIGVRFPEQLALWTVLPMRWSVALLRPITWLFNGSGRLLLRLLGVPLAAERGHVHEPEEIELLLAESERGGQLDREEKEMLRNVFRLSGMITRQVMVPRTRMEAAPVDVVPRDLFKLMTDSPYTRIPIYEGDIDHVIGLVHLKDLFRVCFSQYDPLVTVRDLLRPVTFVPEVMPVDVLWERLGAGRHYLAIVIDEYGGTAGLVTLEDLIEEVFGELQDEFDEEGPLIAMAEDGDAVLRGDVLVSDVNEFLLLNLPTGRAETIGGLVVAVLGRRPAAGDEVTIGGHTLRVVQVDDLAVTRVSLALPQGTRPALGVEGPA